MMVLGLKRTMSALKPGLRRPRSRRANGGGGHLPHRLLQGEEAQLPDVAAQHPGIGAVVSWMRLAVGHRPPGRGAEGVGPHHLEGMSQDASHILLIHGEDDHAHSPLLLEEEVDDRRELIWVPSKLLHLDEVLPLSGLVPLRLDVGDVDVLPPQLLDEVLPPRQPPLDVSAHTFTELRVPKPLQQLLHPPLMGPGGQQGCEARRPSPVGVLIAGDVDAPPAGLLHHLQGLRALTPHLPARSLVV